MFTSLTSPALQQLTVNGQSILIMKTICLCKLMTFSLLCD